MKGVFADEDTGDHMLLMGTTDGQLAIAVHEEEMDEAATIVLNRNDVVTLHKVLEKFLDVTPTS